VPEYFPLGSDDAPLPAIVGTLPARSLAAALGAWSRTGNLPSRSLVGTLRDDD
jgi:hypothetical protein